MHATRRGPTCLGDDRETAWKQDGEQRKLNVRQSARNMHAFDLL